MALPRPPQSRTSALSSLMQSSRSSRGILPCTRMPDGRLVGDCRPRKPGHKPIPQCVMVPKYSPKGHFEGWRLQCYPISINPVNLPQTDRPDGGPVGAGQYPAQTDRPDGGPVGAGQYPQQTDKPDGGPVGEGQYPSEYPRYPTRRCRTITVRDPKTGRPKKTIRCT